MSGCSKRVYDGTFRGHPCTRAVKVVDADSKPWCAIHDPARVSAKRAAKEAVWAARALQSKYQTDLTQWAHQCSELVERIATKTTIPDLASVVHSCHVLMQRKPLKP